MSRNLPAVIPGSASREEQPSAAPRRSARQEALYSAQLLGQDGQKRGLRGGQPVLQAARSAYLEAEHAGEGDRRLPPGTLRRHAV